MKNLPYEIINEILLYLEITCHTCYNTLNLNNINTALKLDKFYYCNHYCYNFI
jgi:hypothetical protein